MKPLKTHIIPTWGLKTDPKMLWIYSPTVGPLAEHDRSPFSMFSPQNAALRLFRAHVHGRFRQLTHFQLAEILRFGSM